MEITYHLSQFDGPLDMLLFMLDKAKIDIMGLYVGFVFIFLGIGFAVMLIMDFLL